MTEMSAAAKVKLAESNEAQNDWYTTCPKCHMSLSGTLAEIKTHVCQKAQA